MRSGACYFFATTSRVGVLTLALVALTVDMTITRAEPPVAPPVAAALPITSPMTIDSFLDRLMLAESGGRDTVANPRSTAVGAFQFVATTFLDLTRRHFATETAHLSPQQILSLRTDRAFARRVADAYTRTNAANLASRGITPTWPHLRLAFFAGPHGAVRVIKAPPQTSVASLMSKAAIDANPFLAGMTAADLIRRAARDLDNPGAAAAGLATAALANSAIPVRCELSLPSCRRWLALAERRELRKAASATRARLR